MRAVKVNKKGFCNRTRRESMENVGLLLSREGDLLTLDVGKAKVLNAFFASVFTMKIRNPEPWRPEGKSEAKRAYPRWKRIRSGNTEANWTYTSPDIMHPRELRELAEVIARPFSTNLESSWRL